MSETVIIALISGIPAALVALAAFINSIRNGAKLDNVESTTAVIHTLVNNDMHLALASIATLSREKAVLSGKAEDIRFADDAEQKLADHDAKQHKVDQGTK